MGDRKALLESMYVAFNQKDLDGPLAGMHPDVDWPNFLVGGRMKGVPALRAYWAEQFAIVDPEASPIAYEELPDGRIRVQLHYLIRAKAGGIWTDEIRYNIFTFDGDRVVRMDWE